MTTGEMIGIGVGVAGLALGAYVLLRPQYPGQGQYGAPVPQVRVTAPAAPPKSMDPGVAIAGDITQGVVALAGLFGNLFGNA